MKKLALVLMLAGALGAAGCNSDGGDDPLTIPNVSGVWTMIGNTIYTFDLTLTQSGETINGLMDATNAGDPTDPVEGTVTAGGTVIFTRVRSGAWTQVYTGTVSTQGSLMVMEGTFTHSGVTGTFPWRANKSVP